jgi:hypothetical protein
MGDGVYKTYRVANPSLSKVRTSWTNFNPIQHQPKIHHLTSGRCIAGTNKPSGNVLSICLLKPDLTEPLIDSCFDSWRFI